MIDEKLLLKEIQKKKKTIKYIIENNDSKKISESSMETIALTIGLKNSLELLEYLEKQIQEGKFN